MRAATIRRAALLAAAASAGPVAGGQLALLAKPFGGTLGIPGAAVGYLALTALLLGSVTGAAATRFPLPARGAGGCAIAAGAAVAAAGSTTSPLLFTTAILLAAASVGPLLVTARIQSCSRRSWLTAWHLAMTAGLAAAAALAAAGTRHPDAALLVAGIATVLCGVPLSILEPTRAQLDSMPAANETHTSSGSAPGRGTGSATPTSRATGGEPATGPASSSGTGSATPTSRATGGEPATGAGLVGGTRSATAVAAVTMGAMTLGYAGLGVLVGGTVLPTLHLLLFRWDALTADQAALLLLAALPAVFVVALPGPHTTAIPILLLLAAGGPVLVATAPGRATAAVGLGLTLAAAARAAHGLDTVYLGRIRRFGSAAVPFGLLTVAGVVGLGAVTVCGRWVGTGTALTLLAVPIALAAACYGRMLAPAAVVRSAAPALEGGSS
ncbi:hypothetical protein LTV02_12505 [Nocardia yamanashiensis]|uniref:hypothetical protein n=1 Tax=Nocardia yamanashiensis TaxID=209247 RepID=UPI001E3B7281|nr:hypothetical protein [Nocardia yamanashiensis]UGT44153.1 hypothetical protein LTV02_12505 [Nocardia yamanashiensis]